jgi:ABC-type multidrug transport system ATPase subunit
VQVTLIFFVNKIQGKTSLLNILAQRVKDFDGDILCNGEPVGKSFRSLSAFVQQDDVMMGNLTVREVLRYAALLRLPSSISIKEKLQRVDEIMDELGLTNAADTKVGVPGISKGISGGERKRLAVWQYILFHCFDITIDWY